MAIEIARSRKKMKPISLIPLINVIFMLLFFFLVAGSLEKFEIVQVDLPRADSGQMLDQGHIIIVLGRHDEILMNDELIGPADLRPNLEQQLKHNRDRLISIKADSQLPAARMIEMMNLIKAAGGRNISMFTQSN